MRVQSCRLWVLKPMVSRAPGLRVWGLGLASGSSGLRLKGFVGFLQGQILGQQDVMGSYIGLDSPVLRHVYESVWGVFLQRAFRRLFLRSLKLKLQNPVPKS